MLGFKNDFRRVAFEIRYADFMIVLKLIVSNSIYVFVSN